MAITDKNKSTFERLQELKQLYESGILTKEEMEAEKADILGQEKPREEEPEQPQASEEQPKNNPKVVLKGTDDTKAVDGNALNKKIMIGAAVMLVAIIALLASLSTCNGRSTDNGVVYDTAADDTTTVDTIAITEYYNDTQAALEKALADNPTVTDFFAIPEISEAVQNECGREFYDFLLSKIATCKDMRIGLVKSGDDYSAETTYWAYFDIKGEDDSSVSFLYSASDEEVTVTLILGDNKVNPDGTFALAEGNKWKLTHENDEFGDPIESKALVYVEGENEYVSERLYMTVSKENPEQIVFYYELPWSDIHDVNKLTAIKIKDKADGSVYNVSNCRYFKDHCILPEEDSKYIRQLCDSSPSASFSIRFEISNYDLLMDTENRSAVFDFNNGRAYGLSNALNHYFRRAF